MSEREPHNERPEDLPVDLDVSGDGVITPEELLAHFDRDHDGVVTVDDFTKQQDIDRLDKSLAKKADRLSGRRRFPRGIEDLVFLGGIAYGIFFFALIAGMSGGVLGYSVDFDLMVSDTPIDPGGECTDKSGIIWLNVYPDEAGKISVRAVNVPQDTQAHIIWQWHGGIEENETGLVAEVLFDHLLDGEHELDVRLFNLSAVEDGNVSNLTNGNLLIPKQTISVEIKEEVKGLAKFGIGDDTPVKEAHIEPSEERNCWSVQQLGSWGWALMAAEWAGGRETAMLAGGSAGVPAWWMAFISLSMSIFFLCVQYPLMYRFYHRETDDMLTEEELERVLKRAIRRAAKKLHLDIEWDDFRMRRRDISIMVFVSYRTTESAVIEQGQVKSGVLKEILAEFKIYDEMTPLQLKLKPIDETGHFEMLFEGRSGVEIPELDAERPAIVEDYSAFFTGIHTVANVEKRVIDCIKIFLHDKKLKDRGYQVGVDDKHIFVRMIYKPKIWLPFFKFAFSYIEIQEEFRERLIETLGENIGGRELIISCRNEVATLADKSTAGRVEQGEGGGEEQAFVAKQGGVAGTLLQNQFMGDILSSVEYVAHENRHRIDRWGFVGLIIFVWIPFMASGVLVGAMLGLVARMSFVRVLIACFAGGAAASITWAYTAEGIIDIMHALNADLFIPIIIGVIFFAAVIHIRTNKKRRREKLFSESKKFFAGELDEVEGITIVNE